MTHTERRLRWLVLQKRFAAGASLLELSLEYNLATKYIGKIVKGVVPPLVEPSSCPVEDDSHQLENQAHADARWQTWKTTHFHTCAELPGVCCTCCHPNGQTLYEVGDDVWLACCGRAKSLPNS